MDIDLLKTFLEVYQTRHFAKAADNLFITPSAVSARIRTLENQVGTPLFMRDRNNIQLTPAGERFLGYAKSILKLWERARYEANLDARASPHLEILAVPSLLDGRLHGWLDQLCLERPDLSLRIEAAESDRIVQRLQQNRADLGFILEPREGPELTLLKVGELTLVLVSSQAGQTLEQALVSRYVMVNWSTSFVSQHTNAFPEIPEPRLWVSLGPLAHGLLHSVGGAAYLPRQMVESELAAGVLHPVGDAPTISLQVFAAYPTWTEQAELIHKVTALTGSWL
jgi:DNA-binding transcriptional LysR family regulator